MVNRNYNNGRAREYRIKKKWEECGFTVVRSAGSHSMFDLVAINPGVKTIALIQVKPDEKSVEKEKKRLEGIKKMFDGNYIVQVTVMK